MKSEGTKEDVDNMLSTVEGRLGYWSARQHERMAMGLPYEEDPPLEMSEEAVKL